MSVCQDADMSQAGPDGPREGVGDLGASVGYLLKQAATALRSAMEVALRPLGLTVAQYACLEQLAHNPGLSNAELARAVFVSRQSMNGVLVGLQERALVTRPPVAPQGRVLPASLTDLGRERLAAASRAVRAVEVRMVDGLDDHEQDAVQDHLHAFVAALAPADRGPGGPGSRPADA